MGQLNFALRVIPMGRVFSKNIARAMSGLWAKHHHTRLSTEVREDLETWRGFLDNFNGTTIVAATSPEQQRVSHLYGCSR